MPSSKRPAEMWSSVTACLASTVGCRKIMLATRRPTLILVVVAAQALYSAILGLMTFGPDARKRPEAKDIVAKFRAKNFEPQAYTLYSYAAVQVIKQASWPATRWRKPKNGASSSAHRKSSLPVRVPPGAQT